MSVLIIIDFMLLYILLIKYQRNKIEVFLDTVIIIFCYLYIVTEILSIFRIITFNGILICWLLFGIVVMIGNIKLKVYDSIGRICKNSCLTVVRTFRENGKAFVFFCAVVGWFLSITLYESIFTVPYNYDSMTYHLARVMNWMQNQSISYYDTNIPRQLFSPIFAEYIILHVIELNRNDIFVNVIQWFAYLISAIGIWGISEQLALSRGCRMLNVIVFLSLPMAIAQSITTQNDLVATMWLIIIAYKLLRIAKRDTLLLCRKQLLQMVMCAAVVGLAYITKQTACIPIIILLLWFLIVRLKKKDHRIVLFSYIGISAMVAGVFVFPTFIRNYFYVGDIFAKDYMSGIMVGIGKPRYLFINFLKNLCMLGATKQNKEKLINLVYKTAAFFNIDVDHEVIAWQKMSFADNLNVTYNHDYAPCALFVLLIIIILFVICTIKIKWEREDRLNISFVVVCGIGFFTLLGIVRWQPWGNRLFLPAISLLVVSIGYVFNKLPDFINQKTILGIILITCMVTAGGVFKYHGNYILTEDKQRYDGYFQDEGKREAYKSLVKYIKEKQYNRIGILLGENDYEYPLWVALKNENTQLKHIVFSKESIHETFDCIIAVNQNLFIDDSLEYGNINYRCVFDFDNTGCYTVLLNEKK